MYTTFKKLPNGDLQISLTDEGKNEAKEFLDRLENSKTDTYHGLWWELNEHAFCNGYHEIADQYKGLTSAPMIADALIDEETTQLEYDSCNIWAFTDYQVKDELRTLLNEGLVVFPLIQAEKELPETPEDISDEHLQAFIKQMNYDPKDRADEDFIRYELFNRVNHIEQPVLTEEKPKIPELQKAIDLLKKNGYSVFSPEEKEAFVSVLNLPANDPEYTFLISWLRLRKCWAYQDAECSNEDIYDQFSILDDSDLTDENRKIMEDIAELCEKYDCSYFRFIY